MTNTPRVLIVMPAQWPRALIRAALREAGYDALGARDLNEALSYPAVEDDRGPVGLIIIDQEAMQDPEDSTVSQLRHQHPDARTLVLESAFRPSTQGSWEHVLRHPVTIADIVQITQQLVPLPSAATHPIDS
jgi:hypothetical protein